MYGNHFHHSLSPTHLNVRYIINYTNSGTQRSASIHRAGTREVHNKLEKNRRAHLKECFEQLKRQLPQMQEEKKTSNLLILSNASKYILVSQLTRAPYISITSNRINYGIVNVTAFFLFYHNYL